MRTSLAFVAFLLPSLALATNDQGSLDALLERIARNSNHALPVNAIPKDMRSDRDVSKNAVSGDNEAPEPQGKEVRMMKRYKRFRDGRRWVWSPSIIQDDTPASLAPPIGAITNLLNTYPVATPKATLQPFTPADKPSAAAPTTTPGVSARSGAPESASSSLPSKIAAIVAKDKDRIGAAAAKHRHQDLGQKLKKKWVWSNSIIQDGDSVPAGAEHTTPGASLIAPTFPPLSAPAEAPSPNAVSSTTTAPSLSMTPLAAPPEVSSNKPMDEAAIFSAIAAAQKLASLGELLERPSAPNGQVKMRREKRQ